MANIFGRLTFIGESKTAGNMGLAKAGGQWLIEVLCFYFTFCSVIKFCASNNQLVARQYVLLNRHFIKPLSVTNCMTF